MKILLVSDIHLGVKNNSELFIHNTRDFFLTQVKNEIVNGSIDQLWILGDLFDCRNNTNVLVNNVALQIMATLISSCPTLQIKILAGNHDIYYKNTLEVSSLKIFKRFHKNIEIITELKEYDLDGCKTLVVPWLVKESRNWNTFMKVCNDYQDTKTKNFSLCLGHFEANGFEIIRGTIEKGGLNEELFEAFDDVFSGHFHLRNKIRNIQYLGCPYEITWGDYGDAKGFTVFDTTTKKATFHQNNISPKHKMIRLSSAMLDKSLLDDIPGNFIKFYIDQQLSTEQHIEWQAKIESLKPLKTEIIVETDNAIDGSSNDIVIESIQGDSFSFVSEYIKQESLPNNVDTDEFILYMKNLHDLSARDGD